MKKGIIVSLVVGSILTTIGAVLFGIGINNEKANRAAVVNTYEITDPVNSFNINISTADIEFKVATDGVSKVICNEREKERHEVSVVDGVLSITYKDELPWYERWFNFNLSRMNVSIYLPSQSYDSLNIKSSTGDITVNKEYSFKDVDISLSTGDVTFASNASNLTKINTSTGDINVNGVSSKEMNLKASTGKINVKDTSVEGALKIETSTGKISLENVTAASYNSTCSTGKVRMTNVIVANDMNVHTSTGDITIIDSDASSVNIEASTGDVDATFLTNKIIYATSSSGKINVPHLTSGGRCDIKTSTGDITVRIK